MPVAMPGKTPFFTGGIGQIATNFILKNIIRDI